MSRCGKCDAPGASQGRRGEGIENSVKVARANLHLFGFIKRLPVEVCCACPTAGRWRAK
jgi:hypothetical protein